MEETPSWDMQSRLAHSPEGAVGRRGSCPALGSVPCPRLGLTCAWAARGMLLEPRQRFHLHLLLSREQSPGVCHLL